MNCTRSEPKSTTLDHRYSEQTQVFLTFRREKVVKVLRGGMKSQRPIVASGVTGEDESDGSVLWRQPRNNGGVVVQHGSVVVLTGGAIQTRETTQTPGRRRGHDRIMTQRAISHLSIVSHFSKRPPTPSMLPCGYCAPGYPHEPSASGLHCFSTLVPSY